MQQETLKSTKPFLKMSDTYQYRLSKSQKYAIANNLIGILLKDEQISDQTRRFVGDWILTGPEGKRKAFFDVWDIVLKNYLPASRPVLFRACKRINKRETIASFTGRLECARRFNEGSGSLIICDTKELLELEAKYYKIGEYRHSFYPLVSVLLKAKEAGGLGFSEALLNDYIGEDEYIMRLNAGAMHYLKWMKNT